MHIGMMRPAAISLVHIYVIGTITLRACYIKTEYKYWGGVGRSNITESTVDCYDSRTIVEMDGK